MSESSQPTYTNPARGIAWMALFFSLLACGISVHVLLKTDDEGYFRERLDRLSAAGRTAGDQLSGVIEGVRGSRRGDPIAEAFNWDRIENRLEDLKRSIVRGESRAGAYLDNLWDDLQTARGFAGEKNGEALDGVMDKLEEARSLMDDSPEEAERVLDELKAEIREIAGDDPPAAP